MEKQPLNCNHSAEECHWKPFTRDSLLRKRSIKNDQPLLITKYYTPINDNHPVAVVGLSTKCSHFKECQ